MRWLGLCLVMGLGAAVAANAHAREAASRPGVTAPAPKPAVDPATMDALASSATIAYPGAEVEFRAASAADRRTASVDFDGAAAKFASSPLRPDLREEPRVLRLMRYSDKVSGRRNGLAWVVIVPDAPNIIYNPAAVGQVQAKCDFVLLLDAHTAAELRAFQSCRGRRLKPAS